MTTDASARTTTTMTSRCYSSINTDDRGPPIPTTTTSHPSPWGRR
ncbi:hypothetical protein ACHAW5_006990 [Stephanodiscus triporus]|uniref:Uncharacterized protein n=1 Tax=Stephanodiscus triporus TaxID=2934178 RepID=A0ABD3P785_9STRA